MALLKRYLPILFFSLSFIWCLKVLLLPNYPDFQVHYYGAQHLLHHQNPYLKDSNYFTPQVYPPFDMVFFIPLLLFPYAVAAKIWIGISIMAVLLSIYFINKLYKIPQLSPISMILSGLVFLAFPTKFTFGMGQINAIILLFTTLIWYYWNKKESIKSGLAFSFAVMLKFFPLLLGLYFLIQRKWKILSTLIISCFVLFLISLYFVSYPIQYHFATVMLPDLLGSWKGDYYNQALSGFLMRNVSSDSIRHVLRIIIPLIMVGFSFVVIFLKKKKSSSRMNLEIAALIILSILINTFSWQHHFIFLLLPFFIIVYSMPKESQRTILPFVFLSYILIALNLVHPEQVPSIIQSHVFFGGVLLWSITMYLLLQKL